MKKGLVFLLMVISSSFLRGQGISVQNAGNLCLANHERIQSPIYQKFKTQEINFDTSNTSLYTAGFLSNQHNKLFLAINNGTNTYLEPLFHP